ncbi:hypothetical protein DL89DRAFT_265939 [Linderina pennispora]|uniref:Uncharacterized protein n=1 Tax=Linderina pennispora TaxID=61395 RepID=A0A1Y1WGW1_9FUNG|nr:uncharacterized protein DL89DRAFT_265939 [Linderina pennispora]ORX72364.1 hypothetical protein DL89DRAFT_265939 [Linderina pennispora]
MSWKGAWRVNVFQAVAGGCLSKSGLYVKNKQPTHPPTASRLVLPVENPDWKAGDSDDRAGPDIVLITHPIDFDFDSGKHLNMSFEDTGRFGSGGFDKLSRF